MSISRTICLGFLGIILTGTLLLWLPIAAGEGDKNNFLVALFTSTSAVCVTGLAVIDTGTEFSRFGQVVIMLLAQVGGLGYMTLTTFLMLIIGRKFDLSQKFAIQETFDRPFAKGSRFLIISIVATTLIGEITGIFLLLIPFAHDYGLDQGLWLATFHSVSAWNNAGFSLFRDNLIGYQDSLVVNGTITGLIIFGGIGYPVIMEAYYWCQCRWRREKRRFVFSLNFKVATQTTLILLLVGWFSLWMAEAHNGHTLLEMNLGQRAIAAWFQSVTTRTAGFNTIDIGKMTTAGLFIMMGLMFIGASPSGTGGGIKTTTLSILANCTRSALQGEKEVVMHQRQVEISLLLKAVGVMFGSLAVVILGTTAIALLDSKFELVEILFETISAFATVGLSTGITAQLSPLSQLVLVLMMYIGRVGVLLFIAAIAGEKPPRLIHFPEENLLVG